VGDRVTFHHLDAREFAGGEYDLAVAHFFFDCFEEDELAALLGGFARRLAVSEFRRRDGRGHCAWALSFFGMTTGLGVTSLPPHRGCWKGWVIESRRSKQGWGIGYFGEFDGLSCIFGE